MKSDVWKTMNYLSIQQSFADVKWRGKGSCKGSCESKMDSYYISPTKHE
jgi:hypothetical protein